MKIQEKKKFYFWSIIILLIIGTSLWNRNDIKNFLWQPLNKRDRKANVGIFVDAIKDIRKHGTKYSFENIKNEDNLPTISWRYKVLPLRMIRFADLNLSELWDSQHNQYQNELCFRGMSFSQISKRSRPITEEEKKNKDIIIITHFQ